MDQTLIDGVLITIAGFVAVYSLTRLMQVYQQRLIFEAREIANTRLNPKMNDGDEDSSEE